VSCDTPSSHENEVFTMAVNFDLPPQPNPIVATVALSLCSFMNAYLMISMFPYGGFMVINLLPGTTVDNVGSYAGLLASSFMIGRFLTSYAWGKTADVYGRIFVLEWTLVLAGGFSLLFGMSKSLPAALVLRFCAGMSNGTLSATKTMATEVSFGNDALERRIMGVVVGMRSWGFLICPAIGGALAEPLSQYPHWQPTGWIRHMLTEYPFLLPNLVAFVLCIINAMLVRCYLPETLPPQKRRNPRHIPGDICESIITTYSHWSKFHCGEKGEVEERMILLEPTQPEFLTNSITTDEPAIMSRPNTRRLLINHWLFAFVSTLVDEAFPLFCMSASAGLAMNEATIGEVLSFAGLIFASLQYFVYILLVNKFGVETCLVVGSILGIQPLLLMPLSLLMHNKALLILFLALVMGACKVFHSLFFTCISLGINKTVPASQRATMNGIQLMGGSLARAFGPIVAGTLTSVAFSSSQLGSMGSLVVFAIVCIIGWVVTCRVVVNSSDREQCPTGDSPI
jgi:MFS family permease